MWTAEYLATLNKLIQAENRFEGVAMVDVQDALLKGFEDDADNWSRVETSAKDVATYGKHVLVPPPHAFHNSPKDYKKGDKSTHLLWKLGMHRFLITEDCLMAFIREVQLLFT